MRGKNKWMRLAAAAVMALLLVQGAASAAPVTDATDTAKTEITDAAGVTENTGESGETEVTGDATAPDDTVPTAPDGQTQPGEDDDIEAPPADTLPERDPEVSYRALIGNRTSWDDAAEWYDEGESLFADQADWETGRTGGQALVFNGNATSMRVDISNQTAPFTLTVWINRQAETAFIQSVLNQHVFTILRSDTDDEIYVSPIARRTADDGSVIANGILLSACRETPDGQQLEELYYPATEAVSGSLPAESWHHVALTVDQQSLTLYIDGILWDETVLPFTWEEFKADTLMIGGSIGRNPSFSGLMEDFRLYEGALTAVQVARLAADADPFDSKAAITPRVYEPTPLPGDIVNDKIFRVRSEDGRLALVATKKSVWEEPWIGAGQSVTGTLTLQNYGRYPVQMRLKNITFPEKGTAAWQYLSQLELSIRDGDQVLYSGPYTELTTDALSIDIDGMSYGGQKSYTITLSCPFDAAVATEEAAVTWSFAYAISEAMVPPAAPQKQILLLLLLPLSAAAVAFSGYWVMTRKRGDRLPPIRHRRPQEPEE